MDARIARTIMQLEDFMRTVDDAMAIPREAGEFIHNLILATRARFAVEIGTSYGYSGLWIASALAQNDGLLLTIDREPRKSEAARVNFAAAGLQRFVDVRTGAALDILASLDEPPPATAGLPTRDRPIDFVLNDADKENCVRYVELLMHKLRDRAVVLTDNSITHAQQLAEFVEWIRKHPDFESAGVPVGNGMELSVKRARDP